MANTIRLKRASGSDPSASDLVTGEIAVRTDNGKLFTKKDNGSVAEITGGGGIDDGDKGDITVSNSGATFTIDSGVIDNANIASDAAISASKISGVMPSSGGTFTGNVSISDNSIEFDSDSGNTNKVSLQGPSSLAANITLTLPNTDGAANEALITDGSGGLSFSNRFMPLSGGTFVDTVTFAGTNYNAFWNKANSRFDLNDNVKLTFGSSQDFQIHHNATDNIFECSNGEIIFKDTSGEAEFKIQGHEGAAASLFLFADEGDDPNDRWKLTAHTDGNLSLNHFKSSTSAYQKTAQFANEGGTELYHSGTKRFETSSSGGTITGTLVADAFTGPLTGNVTGNASGSSGSCTGNAATATALANARTIAGVSFDGTGNISLNNNAITNGAGYITATLTQEQVEDFVGGMVTGNTETGITVTYQDSDGTLDFVVGTLNQDTTGSAATLTTARTIAGVSFDGSANISLNNNAITNGAGYITSSGTSAACSGNAATATKLAATKTIAGVAFDGSANISLNNNAITNGAGYITATLTEEQVEDFVGGMVTGNTETGITVTYQDSDGTLDFVVASQTDNNFTDADHSKLDGIAAGATNVTNNNQLTNGAGYITSASDSTKMPLAGGEFTGDVIAHNIRPDGNGTRALGTTSYRWSNIFTSDLNLSNEAYGGNDVDNTWGDFTIQEGVNDLFLINNRNGKMFKFLVEEVN